MRNFRLIAATIVSALSFCATTQAQTFPSKQVRIVVPYAPGGGIDAIARAMAAGLGPVWGQTIIVENKPGASTFLGTTQVAKAAPDGHTFLLTSESTIVSNPFLFDTLPYDARRDLMPVSLLVSLPQMVVASTSVPAQSIAELVGLARKDSSKLNYASYGSGSLPHIFYEALNKTAGTSIAQAPYKGIIPAVAAIAGGEVQLTLVGASLAQPQIANGKIRPMAVVGRTRLSAHQAVPTLSEAGFGEIDPGESWFGLFVTGGSPADIPARVQKDVAATFSAGELREKHVIGRGLTPVFSTPAEFAQTIEADSVRMQKLVKLTGVRGEQ